MSQNDWSRIYEDLVNLGWQPGTTDGIDGLVSPHDAIFVSASSVSGAARESLVTALRRKVETLESDLDEGRTPLEQGKPALRDFRQLLAVL